jgi:hypothetical protein
MVGAIFETAVLSEIIKTISHRGQYPQVYLWRTAAEAEVDIVVAEGGRLIPLETKLSAQPRPTMARHLKVFQKDLEDHATPGAGSSRAAFPRPLIQESICLAKTRRYLHATRGYQALNLDFLQSIVYTLYSLFISSRSLCRDCR